MFFLMQIIFIVLPSNMAAVQNLYIPRNSCQFVWALANTVDTFSFLIMVNRGFSFL